MVTIYDLAVDGYEYWDVAAIGLFFSGIGFIFKRRPAIFNAAPGSSLMPWMPGLFFWGGLFWAFAAFGLTYSEYAKQKELYKSGQYDVVEGVVEAVLPARRAKRGYQSIKIDGEEYVLPLALRSEEGDQKRLLGKEVVIFEINKKIIYMARIPGA
ncbi:MULTISPECIES: hypothetical protein [Kordiimonas]|jgi:hypothetical protein|uniref:hypothetical protein n=1 Tax=Kordiimonas TaxID=288021 RepID=UPI00257A1AD6|nr:hypothetical protein [Kordiimonas sp. UBA4487]